LESELFGHEKGAFTGAEKRREGRIRQADGGSLFLDEVSEMPLTMQVKLLRVLQERELTRVGGEDVIRVDIRLIAATNKNLPTLIDEERFREDLYYRLNVVGLHIPALLDRREDIPLLANHFLERFADRNQKKIVGFTPRAMNRMIHYDWPGNVRELMNAIERAVVLARSEYLDAEDFPLLTSVGEREDESNGNTDQLPLDGELSLEQVERATILSTLKAVDGNKSEAARRLGITRKTLHQKLKRYGQA
jgi:two-component system response regulator HydG